MQLKDIESVDSEMVHTELIEIIKKGAHFLMLNQLGHILQLRAL